MSKTEKPDSVARDGDASTAQAESPSPRRRKLVKGAAALAPSVFTLYSGAARAMNSTALCVARSQDVFDNASHEPRLHLGPNQANAEDPRFHRRYNFEGIVVKEKDVPDGKKARLVYYPGIGYFDPVGNEYLETGNPDEFSYEGTLYVTKRLGMERHDVVCFHSYEIDDDGRPMEVNTDPTGARFCPQDANPVYNSCWSSFSHG